MTTDVHVQQESIPIGCTPLNSVATTGCQHQGSTYPGEREPSGWVPSGGCTWKVHPPLPLGRDLRPGIHPPVNRHTIVKTLLSRNCVGGR